ncbi:MAG: hypothetical protein WB716_00225, partial [Candidatus Acidiferrales bacterium]
HVEQCFTASPQRQVGPGCPDDYSTYGYTLDSLLDPAKGNFAGTSLIAQAQYGDPLGFGRANTIESAYQQHLGNVAETIGLMAAQKAQEQAQPNGVAVTNINVLPNCPKCGDYGITVAVTYQLTANGQPVSAAGYVFQERIYGGYVSTSAGQATFPTGTPNWGDAGPRAENGNQRATNSSGQYTDAPVSGTTGAPFTGHRLQDLRAVGPGGNIINFGTNHLTFTSSKRGQGLINIDNDKMKIHVSAGTPP